MKGFNKTIIAGNITRDPEVRTTPSGAQVCSFSIAVNRTYTTNGEKRDEVSYFNCSAWGKPGEIINQYMHKGDPILVSGRLRQDRWEDKETGKARSSIEIVVEDFNFLGSAAGGSDASAPAKASKSSSKGEVVPDDIPEGDDPINIDEVPF